MCFLPLKKKIQSFISLNQRLPCTGVKGNDNNRTSVVKDIKCQGCGGTLFSTHLMAKTLLHTSVCQPSVRKECRCCILPMFVSTPSGERIDPAWSSRCLSCSFSSLLLEAELVLPLSLSPQSCSCMREDSCYSRNHSLSLSLSQCTFIHIHTHTL